MADVTPTLRGNARNNALYGTHGDDAIDADAGNDYLRGYGGNDLLVGGLGADRFVFERTLAANGMDTIADFSAAEGDVLDFSLVGFARGVFSRYQLSDILRVDYSDGVARVQIDLDGGGSNAQFQTWAILGNAALDQPITVSVGGRTFTPVVTDTPPQIQSFRVSGLDQLTVRANEASTARLVVSNSAPPGTPIGNTTQLTADVDGTITVAAQLAVTETVLRVSDATNSVAPALDPMVYLGTNGGDTVTGTSNADILFSFDGDDTLTGGAGADTLTGGEGVDTFVFAQGSSNATTLAGADVVQDFTTGVDRIDVGSISEFNITTGQDMTSYGEFIAYANSQLESGQSKLISAYNAANSGDAWILVDRDASGAFNAENDIVMVLIGISEFWEYNSVDFGFGG